MNYTKIIAALVAAVLLVATGEARSETDRQATMDSMIYEVELLLEFDEAIERVTEALKAEQFGIISRIDLHTTFKKKLGVDGLPHTILGACNPKLAHKAVSTMPEAAIMLPCSVTVQALEERRTTVRIVSPNAVMAGAGLDKNPIVREVGEEADAKLKRVAQTLSAH